MERRWARVQRILCAARHCLGTGKSPEIFSIASTNALIWSKHSAISKGIREFWASGGTMSLPKGI
jgi:hypothetical protein